MMVTMAFLVRGLQLLLGSSKRALTERAEEMGVENDSIPLTQREESIAPSIYTQGSTVGNMDSLPSPPISAQDPSSIRGTGGPPADPGNIRETLSPLIIHQDPAPLTQVQQRAAVMSKNVDIITYGALFLFVGIPIYYSTGYAMPMHLSLSVLAYFAALALPPNYKKVLHPVLVSSVIIVPSIWIFALTRRSTLHASLEAYSTGTKYLQVWSNQKDLRRPGAGDVFSSVLDASIVSLALPMFQYRAELRRHFLSIIIPNVVISIASLFGYPSLCYAIGIAPKQSLSFAARSLTLALAQPATANLGGDLTLVAVLCITSGILGVIFGPTMLKWLRIPDDDYVTRGVTLGGNSSALATALLLVTDPRAAALSSLSMGLFGAIMVALTSVPPIARAVAGLVGL
ncbi:MAG: hypothetical protein MMC33_008086 [Icmadophila ericetorum]|nr:hypothetical protein [Icmadophila ericetorum]